MSEAYSWYNVTTKDFLDNTKSQRVLFDVNLENIGEKTIEVLINDFYSVLVDGVYLPIGLNGKNPINKQDRSAELDLSGNLWVGFKDEI